MVPHRRRVHYAAGEGFHVFQLIAEFQLMVEAQLIVEVQLIGAGVAAYTSIQIKAADRWHCER